MSEEQSLQAASTESASTDVNATQADASSTSSNQTESTSTPASAETSVEKTDNRIPYTRFKEVIQEKNELLQRLEKLETGFKTVQERQVSNQPNAYDRAVTKFKAKGLDDESAKLLAETAAEIAKEQVDSRMAPVERVQVEREIEQQLNKFAKSHSDFDAVFPTMQDTYFKMSSADQRLVASSPSGLEMLYAYVQQRNIPQKVEEARKQGVEQAYTNKATKAAVASAQGAANAPNPVPSQENVQSMSLDAYIKDRERILKGYGISK